MAEGLPTRATRASRSRVVAGTPRGCDGRRLNARTASSRSRWRKSSVGMRLEGTVRSASKAANVDVSPTSNRAAMRALIIAQAGDQMAPKPAPRTIADSANQSLDDRDARQKHLVGDQPGRGSINKGAGPIIAAPAKGIEPSGQSKTRHRVVAKVREAAVRPDEREVPDAPASHKIGIHVRTGFKSELFDHDRQDRRWDIGGRNWECAQKPGARQHHGTPEPIVVAAQSSNEVAISLVQMEISRELVDRRFAVEAGKALTLGVGEVMFEEKISGAVRGRPEFEKLMGHLRKDDILIVARLDRLARSTIELLHIAERIKEKQAGLQSLDEPWADTTSPSGVMIMTVFAGIAQFERALILSRTDEVERRRRRAEWPSDAQRRCDPIRLSSLANSCSRASPSAPWQGPSTFIRRPSIAVTSQTAPYDTFLFHSAARPWSTAWIDWRVISTICASWFNPSRKEASRSSS